VISTHVLDTAEGLPAAGLKVGLFRGQDLVALRETDEDGRIPELAGRSLEPGEYRIVFYTENGFIEKVEVTIAIPTPDEHYHVPLLLSPFACTIYRGS
jgi:5-hydroxyisourate hydrolase